MLTKTCWRRTRVFPVMIFATDFAHSRNIVAGGKGGGILVYFFPLEVSGWKSDLAQDIERLRLRRSHGFALC